jgi:hypothetical protein
VIQRLLKDSGVAALIACFLTPIAYLFATRHDGRFHNAFQNHWETVGATVALVVLGLLEMGRGLALCYTVLGAFEDANLKRGVVSLLAGGAIAALGAVVLYNIVFS